MELFFPTFPDYEHIDKDCTRARLLSDYHFAINGVNYVIKRDFEWDGASIPKLMRWKYGSPFDLVHIIGGLVHDSIYANEIYYSASGHRADFTRLKADNIYFALIHKMGATVLRAFKEWLAVRFCGYSHWYNYKKGKVMKNIMKILGAVAASIVALVVLAGCKSISFERVDGEKVVRGSYYAYGIENNLEGLEIIASPTNGVTVRINRSTMDMSKEHKEIIDSSSAAAGTAVGAAAAAMIK